MAHYRATVPSTRTQEETWDYLADFRSTAEWDPSIVRTHLVDGTPGEPGARFAVTFRQLGRESTLDYVTLEAVRPHRLVYRAVTRSVTSLDTITVGPDASVTYEAQLELHGVRKVLDPVLQLVLTRASDKARDGLAAHLA